MGTGGPVFSEWFSFTLPHAKISRCEGAGTGFRAQDASVLVLRREEKVEPSVHSPVSDRDQRRTLF